MIDTSNQESLHGNNEKLEIALRQTVEQTAESKQIFTQINEFLQDEKNIIDYSSINTKFLGHAQELATADEGSALAVFHRYLRDYVKATEAAQGIKDALVQKLEGFMQANGIQVLESVQQLILGYSLYAINFYLTDVKSNQQSLIQEPKPEQEQKLQYKKLKNALFGNEDTDLTTEQQIILDKVLKVFEKLGQEKLKEISENRKEAKNASILEKIGHYLNKLIRGLTLGYVGYEFSTVEAKEAINTGLNHLYHEDKQGFFTDNNTRFAQVVKKAREKAAPASNDETQKDILVIDNEGFTEISNQYIQRSKSFVQAETKKRSSQGSDQGFDGSFDPN